MLGLFSESTIQSNDAIITKVNVENLTTRMHIYYEMGTWVVTLALLSRAQTKCEAYNPSVVAVDGLLVILTSDYMAKQSGRTKILQQKMRIKVGLLALMRPN